MTIQGVDYSYARPTGTQLAKAGKKFAVRYITDPGQGAKGISQAEWDDLTAHGISIVFVWEGGAGDANKGRVQGVADAKHAQANLHRLNGPSDRRPIYFAVDFDARGPEVAAYFQGVASVLGKARTGAYAGYDPIAYLTSTGLIGKRWQTYAWSSGRRYSPMDILQYRNGVALGSGTVDLCEAYSANYGQKAVILAKPVPKPVLVPINDLQVFIRNRDSRAIYSVGPETNTIHHVTPIQWTHWKALGYRFVDVPATALKGLAIK